MTANGPTASRPYGEIYVRRIVRTAKWPYGELYVRQTGRTAKRRTAKWSTANVFTANGPTTYYIYDARKLNALKTF